MKTLIIIPYFGKLPNYFQLWLKSAKLNKSFNWLLILDDTTQYDYPENCLIIYKSFEELKKIISNKFDFNISLENPYKLCDYRPAYGYIFNKYLKGYDFWGYGDIDLIYGNMSKFITDDILNKYDRILPNGHLSLYRNCEFINTAFRLEENGYPTFKKVFTTNRSFSFDEWAGITSIFKKKGIKQYTVSIMADISWINFKFRHTKRDNNNYDKQFFIWDNGEIHQVYLTQNKIETKEFIYIHLQKRSMKLDQNINEYNSANSIIIRPNSFIVNSNEDYKSHQNMDKYTSLNIYDMLSYYLFVLNKRCKNFKKKLVKSLNTTN